MNIIKYLSLVSIVVLGISVGCKKEGSDASLEQLVKGVYFGMDQEVFFKHCWDMNQVGETHHGSLDNNVMYLDSTNFSRDVFINFYPDFNEKKEIKKFPMKFYYRAWSPWNKNELTQDGLQKEVVKFMEMKYGPGFKEKVIDEKHTAYYKVIGPLVVRIYKDLDEMIVRADITHDKYTDK